mmetsp:Transcript_2447/g.3567  ORF Transcript_2447/g.3567 Transcript_2447/m.3567 type:complete len:373 (+) Transcript_2447:44-1162(+)
MLSASIRRLTPNSLSSSTRLCKRFSSGSKGPYKVLQFHGDGVGPEIVGAAERVLEATGVKIDWVRMDMGYETYERTGHVITEEHLQALEEIKVLFKGPLTIPPGKNPYTELRGRKFTSGNQVLRKCFDLYANVRPAKLFPGLQTRFENVDLLVVRENTEDVYTGEEKWVNDDTVEGVKRITRKASTRIAEKAFELAVKHGRKRVTAVHKANVCKQADGFFLDICRDVSTKYPDITFDDQLADSLLTKMVMNPSEWDVLLCPNLYGDMVSDLAAGIVGSLGLCPSGQYGEEYAVFEPCHGSAPDIAGKDISNPVSQVLSGAMLLRHLGEPEAATKIEEALERVTVKGGNALTPDLGGSGTNTSMTDEIIKELD